VFRKSVLITLLITLIALFAALPCLADEPLLKNSGFEESSVSIPRYWSQSLWTSGADVSLLAIDTTHSHTGEASLSIENLKPNDAQWQQSVTVKPGTLYHLSGWIQADQVGQSAKGANLSVMGVLETSNDVFATEGKWVQVDLYGMTGDTQTEIVVAARIGGYGSLNTGKAYFDDLSLIEAASAPAGMHVISFDPQASAPAQAAEPGSSDSSISIFPIILLTLAFTLLFLFARLKLMKKEPLLPLSNNQKAWLTGAFIASFVFRLFLAIADHGHPIDMGTFSAWAMRTVQVGLDHFYDGDVFADYPPGYIYVLYAIGLTEKLLGIDPSGGGMRLLVKLPAIIADMASAYLIFRFGRKTAGTNTAMALALLFLFNPAVWVDSAAWGQVDSIYALLLIASLLELSRGKWNRSAVLYAVTVLIKPQALIVAPVVLLALIYKCGWKHTGRALLSAAAAFIVLLLPFSTHKDPLWIVDLYKTTLASYPYATLNAFNLFALIGGNWAPVQENPWIFSYQTWGTVLMAAALAWTVWLYAQDWRFGRTRQANSGQQPPNEKLNSNTVESVGHIFLLACLLLTAVFILGPKMHERYMYPSMILSLFAFLKLRDIRLLYIFFGISLTQYWNIGYVLAFARKSVYQIPKWDAILLFSSFINVILLGYLAYTAYDLLIRRRLHPIETIQNDQTRNKAESVGKSRREYAAVLEETPVAAVKSSRFGRKEWLLLGGLTLVYAIIALYHLGSLSAPQSYWQPANAGDSFTVEFSSAQQLERMNSYGGVGESKFRVEFSTEGTNWSQPITVNQNYATDFTWIVTKLNVTAKYARVTTENAGLMLNELVFYASGSDQPVSIKSVTGDGVGHETAQNPEHAIDEQNIAVYTPSFMNGTYFDEIYHARTAYEHLHGITPYETTHPPLGKLLISVGILLFGMDPFGWRIIGTLFGIAMIPIIYLFARRLFGKMEYAFAAAFLMAFDFMHFTQTRIATIDVYGVFFIILMFYFMYRYYMLNFYRVPFKETLVPLFWSGLFFGIGAASKWIVIYGGAGLALLFFLTLLERYREYDTAKQRLGTVGHGSKQKQIAVTDSYRKIVEQFPLLSLKTIAWCTLFFVIIPAVIYTLSFLPALTAHGDTFSFKRLIQYQISMFDYQSQLKATHPFSSNWYQWPFITKPLWYYAGQFLPDGLTSTIVAMGNPAIWWVGIVAVFTAIFIAYKRKDRGMFVVLVAFFSQYIPWILVKRLTFIYHFFAMVPFLILCLVYVIKYGIEHRNWNIRYVYAYFAVVLLLFILFYPALSGMEVSREYVDKVLLWFSAWHF
jgi:dolichyl-phosphate-mannose-protein mannosyltransferase